MYSSVVCYRRRRRRGPRICTTGSPTFQDIVGDGRDHDATLLGAKPGQQVRPALQPRRAIGIAHRHDFTFPLCLGGDHQQRSRCRASANPPMCHVAQQPFMSLDGRDIHRTGFRLTARRARRQPRPRSLTRSARAARAAGQLTRAGAAAPDVARRAAPRARGAAPVIRSAARRPEVRSAGARRRARWRRARRDAKCPGLRRR